MHMLKIRELRQDDDRIISAIIGRNASRWDMTPQYFRERHITPAFQDEFPFVFIAFYNGVHAGEILLVIEKEGYCGIKNQPWITALYVKPEFRRRGIGQALVQTTQEKCREYAFPSLYLDTASSAGYYDKLGGWERIGEGWWEVGDRSVVVMKCNLIESSAK